MSQIPNLVTVNIDGQELQVPKGMNMILAAAQLKKEIPHYCYHPKLSVVGNCRMCLIEMGLPMKDRTTGQLILDEQGQPKIGWSPKPAIACTTEASEGLHIRTQSPLVDDCRKGVMEFLLINHPLDCPICDQAGECSLQEFATDYGRGYSRFVEDKNVKPKRTALGPRVTLDDERCILCSRCIRFMREIAKDDVLGFVDRGSYSTLTCYPGKELTNNYSLNTVDICPVGALTSTDFRFKMRVWFLKKTKSICTESSVGANTYVWSREGVIYRITPRQNDAVNDSWMSDSGRDLYKQVHASNRLKEFRVHNNKMNILAALERTVDFLKESTVSIVASPHQSLEEQYLVKKLAQCLEADVHIASHKGEGDKILISEDRAPNTRGTLVVGLTQTLPKPSLQDLAEKIATGQVKTLIICGEDVTALGISSEQLKKINVIYIGTHSNSTEAVAKIVLPSLTMFEKSGSFINQQFRLQRFEQAIPGSAGLMPDIFIFEKLLFLLGYSSQISLNTVSSIWQAISAEFQLLAGITFESITDQGTLLSAAPFSKIHFPEGPSLKYAPQSEFTTTHPKN